MIRVRFAPSPTGSLHVGNCRTAVLNWIFARHTNGKYILRIEDTDIERSTGESEAGILDDLKWLGLNWDEGPDIGGEYGPYRQSERLEIYKEKAEKLLEEGRAYRCFCTQEELDEEKDALLKKGLPPKYSGKCRKLSEEQINKLLNEKKLHSIRFHIQKKDIEINDLVMGTVTFKSDVLSDFIILRSNGRASYNFAVVVDDSMMEITHVIRGGDHLSNTPKQMLLFDAFSQKPPVFAHIPMITGIDGTRLSKRDGAVSVGDYREMGILPEALINFLSLLSWSSPSGEEILSKEKLIKEFDFIRFSKSPAAFDMKKLLWMNGNYIRSYDREKLTELILPYFPDKNDEKIPDIVDIIYNNLEYLSQTPQKIEMFYAVKVKINENADYSILKSEEAKKLLSLFIKGIDGVEDYSQNGITAFMKGIIKKLGVSTKQFMQTVRLSLTGKDHGPDIVKVVKIFGKEKCKRLMKSALNL